MFLLVTVAILIFNFAMFGKGDFMELKVKKVSRKFKVNENNNDSQ